MSQALLLLHQPRAQAVEERRRSEHLRALESPHRNGAAGRNDAEITVRALHEGDRPAVESLAGLDSAQLPTGYVLGAEIDGELVATISLTDGSVIADPFRTTTSAIELLRLRASQLGAPSGRRRLPRLRRRGATPRARGALAGSPPGGGSHLLQL